MQAKSKSRVDDVYQPDAEHVAILGSLPADTNPDDWPSTAIITDFVVPVGCLGDRRHIEVAIPSDICRALSDTSVPCRRRAFLAAAVGVLIAKYTAQEKITIAVPAPWLCVDAQVTNRVLPLRLSIRGATTFSTLCQAIERCFDGADGVDQTARPEGQSIAKGATLALAFTSILDVTHVGRIPFDLAFVFVDHVVDKLVLRVVFEKTAFLEETVWRLARHLIRILAATTQLPSLRVAKIDLIDVDERRLLLEAFHQNRRDYPVRATAHQLFTEQAKRTPMMTAVEFDSEQLTYSELDDEANRLAQLLCRAGVKPRDNVPILHRRNERFLVALLAVLKSGAAFLPIDTKLPTDRVEYMLKHAECTTLITEAEFVQAFMPVADRSQIGSVVTTNRVAQCDVLPRTCGRARLWDRDDWNKQVMREKDSVCCATDPAYLIYTSGSTGVPKAVVIRHEGMINHIFAEIEDLTLGPGTRLLQTAQLSTDLCIWQFLAPVLIGGTTVIAHVEDIVDPRRLLRILQHQCITIVEVVPFILRALVDHASRLSDSERQLPCVRRMMVTGEPIPVHVVNEWFELYPEIPIVNAYGPSEVSDDTAQLIVTGPLPENTRSVPIGRPLANLQVYVLDQRENLVPVGVPGEICVSGIGVADGYWRDNEKTRERFVFNPFRAPQNYRMYKTGDLGRWLPNGTLELLGRVDDQVKIRGFRVELGEIENVLSQHSVVKECVVIARDGAAGTRCLVAYVVPNAPVTVAVLRDYLRDKLPDYMVPSIFVLLEALPLTANGVKVDRNALPSPTHERPELEKAYVAPRTAVEAKLAAIWAGILNIEQIGIHDNFFELGGDSLMTVQMAVWAEQEGLKLPMTAIFERPTIVELAAVVGAVGKEDTKPNAAIGSVAYWPEGKRRATLIRRYGEFEDIYPMSPTQLGLYLYWLMSEKTSGVYVEQISGIINDARFNFRAFEKAWSTIISLHPVLRTIFVRQGLPRPHQLVVGEGRLEYQCRDLRRLPAAHQHADLTGTMQQEVRRPFRLEELPLMRLVVSQLSAEAVHITWTYPHILMDGWSEAALLTQVLDAYCALSRGKQPALPASPPFKNYIAWLSGIDTQELEAFWRGVLKGFVRPTPLPLGRAFDGRGHAVERFAKLERRLSGTVTARLYELARQHRWTINSVLQGAWGCLLGQMSGHSDIVFGAAVSGRQIDLAGIDKIIGLLVNSVPVRMKLDPHTLVVDWLHAVQQDQFKMRRYEHAPLVSIVGWSEVPKNEQPLFSTYFVLANYPDAIMSSESETGFALRQLEFHTLPEYPITVFVQPSHEVLIRLLVDSRRFEVTDMKVVLDRYCGILLKILENPFGELREVLRS